MKLIKKGLSHEMDMTCFDIHETISAWTSVAARQDIKFLGAASISDFSSKFTNFLEVNANIIWLYNAKGLFMYVDHDYPGCMAIRDAYL